MRTLSRKAKLTYRVSIALSMGLFGVAPVAFGMPSGNTTIAGAPTVATSGNTMDITSTTPSNIISWQEFSVAHDETVKFDGGARANDYLNIVVGANESNIAGTIMGGNNVGIVNEHGVIFAEGSTVNVGNLYVSTAPINPADYTNIDTSTTGVIPGIITGNPNAPVGEVVNLADSMVADSVYVEGDTVMFLNTAHVNSNNITISTETSTDTYGEVKIGHPASLTGDTGDVSNTQNDTNFVGKYTINGVAAEADTDLSNVNVAEYTTLYTADQLQAINTAGQPDYKHGAYYNGLGGNYFLGSDIVVNTEDQLENDLADWTPIGGNSYVPFSGNFDGVYHKVSNIFIGDLVPIMYPGTDNIAAKPWSSDIEFAGLFGKVKGESAEKRATIKNVGLDDTTGVANIIGQTYAGGIAGYAENAEISSVYTKGMLVYASSYSSYEFQTFAGSPQLVPTINDTKNVGGIVGYLGANSVLNEAYSSAVSGSWAGVVGVVESGAVVENVYNTGIVKYGIATENHGTIKNVYNTFVDTAQGQTAGGEDDAVKLVGNGTYINGYTVDTTNGTINTSTPANGIKSASSYAFTDDDGNSAISRYGNDNTVWRIYEGHSLPMLRSFLRAKNGVVTVSGYGDQANLSQQANGDYTKIYNGKYTVSGNSKSGLAASSVNGLTFTSSKGAQVDKSSASYGWGVEDAWSANANVSGGTLLNSEGKELTPANVVYITAQNGFEGYDLIGDNITIKQRPLTLTASHPGVGVSENKVYDGTTTKTVSLDALGDLTFAAATSTTGVISGDDVRIAGSGDTTYNVGDTVTAGTGTITYASKDVGKYSSNYTAGSADLDGLATLTIDGASLAGDDAINYALTVGNVPVTSEITPRPVYITVNKTGGINKIYDGSAYVTDSDVVGGNTQGQVLTSLTAGDKHISLSEVNNSGYTTNDETGETTDNGFGFVTGESLDFGTITARYESKNVRSNGTSGDALGQSITYDNVAFKDSGTAKASNYQIFYSLNKDETEIGNFVSLPNTNTITLDRSTYADNIITRRPISGEGYTLHDSANNDNEVTSPLTKTYDGNQYYGAYTGGNDQHNGYYVKTPESGSGNSLAVSGITNSGIVSGDTINFVIGEVDTADGGKAKGVYQTANGTATSQVADAAKVAFNVTPDAADEIINNYTFQTTSGNTPNAALASIAAGREITIDGKITPRVVYVGLGNKTTSADIYKDYDGTDTAYDDITLSGNNALTLNNDYIAYSSGTPAANKLVADTVANYTPTVRISGAYQQTGHDAAAKDVNWDGTQALDKNVVHTVGIYNANGELDTNYVISLDNGTSSTATATADVTGAQGIINQRAVTPEFNGGYTKIYDGTNVISLDLAVNETAVPSGKNFSTGVGEETLTVDGTNTTMSFDDVNAGSIKSITYENIALADGNNGGLATNYKVVDNKVTATTIETGAGIILPRQITTDNFGLYEKDANGDWVVAGSGTAQKTYDNTTDYTPEDGIYVRSQSVTPSASNQTGIIDSDYAYLDFALGGAHFDSANVNAAPGENTVTYSVTASANADKVAGGQTVSTRNQLLNNYTFDSDFSYGGTGATLADQPTYSVTGAGDITPRTLIVNLAQTADINKVYNGTAEVDALNNSGTVTGDDYKNVVYGSGATTDNKLVADTDTANGDGVKFSVSAAYQAGSGYAAQDVERDTNGNVIDNGKNVVYNVGLTESIVDGFDKRNNYLIKTTGGGTVNGDNATNFTATGAITPAAATINFDEYRKVYDGTKNVNTADVNYTVTGIGDETLNLGNGYSAQFNNANAGSRTVTYGNLTLANNGGYKASNYEINYTNTTDKTVDGNGYITPRILSTDDFTLKDDAGNTYSGQITKTYDGTTDAKEYIPDGMTVTPNTVDENADTSSGTGILFGDYQALKNAFVLNDAKFTGKNAGKYDNNTSIAEDSRSRVNYIATVNTANIDVGTNPPLSAETAEELAGNYTFTAYNVNDLANFDTATPTLTNGTNIVGHGAGVINRRAINVQLAQYENLDKTYNGTSDVNARNVSNTSTYIDADASHNVQYATGDKLINDSNLTDTDGNPVSDDAAFSITAKYDSPDVAYDANGNADQVQNITYTVAITGDDAKNYQLVGGGASSPSSITDYSEAEPSVNIAAAGTIYRAKVTPTFATYSKTYDGSGKVWDDLLTANPWLSTGFETGINNENAGADSLKLNTDNYASDFSFAPETNYNASATNGDKTINYTNLSLEGVGGTNAGNYMLVDANGDETTSLTGTGTITRRQIALEANAVVVTDSNGDTVNVTKVYDADSTYGMSGKNLRVTLPEAGTPSATNTTGVIAADSPYIVLSGQRDSAGNLLDGTFVNNGTEDKTIHANGVQYKVTLNQPDSWNRPADEFNTLLNNYTLDGTNPLTQGGDMTVTGAGTITPRTIKLALTGATLDKTYDGDADVKLTNGATELYGASTPLVAYAGDTPYKLVGDDYNDRTDNTTISLTGQYLAEGGTLTNNTADKNVLNDEDAKDILYTASIAKANAGGADYTENYVIYFETNGNANTDNIIKADGGKILRKEVTPELTAGYARQYDGTKDIDITDLGAYAPTVSGAVDGESLIFNTTDNPYTATFDDKNATPVTSTNDRTITYANFNLASGDGATLTNNYKLNATNNTTTGTINPYVLTANNFNFAFNGPTKIYDAGTAVKYNGSTNPADNYGAGNYVTAHNITLSNNTTEDFAYGINSAYYTDKNVSYNANGDVASDKEVNFDITLTDASNYDYSNLLDGNGKLIVTQNNGKITPAPITVSLNGPIEKTYDAETGYDKTGDDIVGFAGIFDGDTVNNDSTVEYLTKKAEEHKSVTYTFAKSGTDAANYYLTTDSTESGTVSTLTDDTNNNKINKRELSVTFGDVYKTYDGTANVTNTQSGTAGEDNSTDDIINYIFSDEDAAVLQKDKSDATASSGVLDTSVIKDNNGTGSYYGTLNGNVFTQNANANNATTPQYDVQYNNIQAAFANMLGDDAANYTIADTQYGTGTINKRILTPGDFETGGKVTVDYTSPGASEKVYNGTTTADAPAVAATINLTDSNGNGSTVNLTLTATGNYDTEHVAYDANGDVAANKTIDYTFSLGDDAATLNNFGIQDGASLTQSITTGKITPKEITGTLVNNAVTKVYDGGTEVKDGNDVLTNEHLVTFADDAFVTRTGQTDADSATVSANYQNKNAGSGNKQVDYVININDGNNGGNYKVSINDADGTAAATSNVIDNTYAETVAANGANVSRTFTTDGNSITKRPVSITFADQTKAYDGTRTADTTLQPNFGEVSGESVSGLVTGEDLTVATTGNDAYTAEYNSKNVADADTVTYENINLADGANGLADNYEITSYIRNNTEYDFANQRAYGNGAITPRTITAAISDAAKVYDGTTNFNFGTLTTQPTVTFYDGNGTSGTSVAGITGDNMSGLSLNDAFATWAATFTDRNAGGNNRTVNYTGLTLNDGNYALSTDSATNTTSTISPRHITANIANDSLTKNYNADTDVQINDAAADGASLITFADSSNYGDGYNGLGEGDVNAVTAAYVDNGTSNAKDVSRNTNGLVQSDKSVTYDLKITDANGNDISGNYVIDNFAYSSGADSSAVTGTQTTNSVDNALSYSTLTTSNNTINPYKLTVTQDVIPYKIYDSTNTIDKTSTETATIANGAATRSGTADGTSLSLSGIFSGDTVNITDYDAEYANANANVYANGTANGVANSVNYTGIALDNGNYTADDLTGQTGIIAPRVINNLVLNFEDDISKVYDGSDSVAYDHTNPASYTEGETWYFDGETGTKTADEYITGATLSIAGLDVPYTATLGGDGFYINSATYNDANVGNKEVTYEITLSGTMFTNFTDNFEYASDTLPVTGTNVTAGSVYDTNTQSITAATTGTITPKEVRAAIDPTTITKVYDGTKNAQGTLKTNGGTQTNDITNMVTLTGLVASDGTSLDTDALNATYNSKNVTEANSITYDVVLKDSDSADSTGNYTFADTNGAVLPANAEGTPQITGNGTITPKYLTVDFTTASKVYDEYLFNPSNNSVTNNPSGGSNVHLTDFTQTDAAGSQGYGVTAKWSGYVDGETINDTDSATLEANISGVYGNIDEDGVFTPDGNIGTGSGYYKAVQYSGLDNLLNTLTSDNTDFDSGNYSLDPNQIVSGTLTYSVADEKGIISPRIVSAEVTPTIDTSKISKEYDGTSSIEEADATAAFGLTANFAGQDLNLTYDIDYDNTYYGTVDGSGTQTRIIDAGTGLPVVFKLANVDATFEVPDSLTSSPYFANFALDTSQLDELTADGVYYTSAANSVTGDGTSTAAIDPRRITAELSQTTDINKIYDGTKNAPDYVIYTKDGAADSVLANDLAAGRVGFSVNGTYDDKNAATGYNVNYAATITGDLGTNNYIFDNTATSTDNLTAYLTGTGDINRRMVYATLRDGYGTEIDKTYDGKTTVNGYHGGDLTFAAATGNTGVVTGDELYITAGSVNYSDKNVSRNGDGTAATKNIYYTDLALSGADMGNYTLGTSSVTGSGTINPKEISVTLKDRYVTKEYDGTINVRDLTDANGKVTKAYRTDNIRLVDDPMEGDTLTVTTTGASYADKNAGQGLGLTYFIHWDNENYELVRYTTAEVTKTGTTSATLTDTSGIINPRSLTAEVSGTATKTYDGTTDVPNAAANINVSRVLTGEDAGIIISGAFDNPNAASGENEDYMSHLVTYYLKTSNPNYKFANATATGDGYIYRAPLTLTADPLTFVEGDPLPANYSGTVSGLIDGGTGSASDFSWQPDGDASNIYGSYGVWGWYGGRTSGNYGTNYTFSQDPANATALHVSPFYPGAEYNSAVNDAAHVIPDANVFADISFDGEDYNHDSAIAVQYAGNPANVVAVGSQVDIDGDETDWSKIGLASRDSVVNLYESTDAADISTISIGSDGTIVNIDGVTKDEMTTTLRLDGEDAANGDNSAIELSGKGMTVNLGDSTDEDLTNETIDDNIYDLTSTEEDNSSIDIRSEDEDKSLLDATSDDEDLSSIDITNEDEDKTSIDITNESENSESGESDEGTLYAADNDEPSGLTIETSDEEEDDEDDEDEDENTDGLKDLAEHIGLETVGDVVNLNRLSA